MNSAQITTIIQQTQYDYYLSQIVANQQKIVAFAVILELLHLKSSTTIFYHLLQ